MQKINLVMLGHLDHGKSTLIGRILYDTQTLLPDKIKEVESIWKTLGKNNEFAFFLDAFQEEVEEGMTIDTIQVTLKTKKQEYSLIDCPGHKEFTKNMLSGASQASTAILVISARKEEGIQEQTKRHIFLAKMLGIEQLFVVVNKMDAINYDEKRFNEIKQQAEEFLRGIGYAKIFFIPISAKNGENVLTKSENMKWYTGDTLLNIVDNNAKPVKLASEKPLRIGVQDIYEVNKEKMVIGRIETGKLKVGEEIIFNPSKEKVRLLSIEKFNEIKKEAFAGESIGLKIQGNIEKIKRGEVCSHLDSQPKIAKELEAQIFLLTETTLNKNESLSIKILTAEKACKISEIIKRIDSSSGEAVSVSNKLETLDSAIIKLQIKEQIVFEKFSDIPELGRFLLIKNNVIAAVGVIK